MKNIVVGVIARDDIIKDTKVQIITKNNLKYLNNKCEFIGILNYDNTRLCNQKQYTSTRNMYGTSNNRIV